MRQEERLELRRRFDFRCGYCGVRERDVGAELTVDHFHPGSKGGADEPDNWVYCCHACNEFKGDFWASDSVLRILHPLRDELGSHLVEELDGTLRGLTDSGRFHIERLQLNRQALIEHRRERRLIAALRNRVNQEVEAAQALDLEVQAKIAALDALHDEPNDG